MDNAIRYEIMTLVLKICKNLLDARRLEQTFAPRPLPAEHTFASACGKLVDNFEWHVDNLWITFVCLWITFTNVGNRLPTYRSYDTRKPLHDNVYDSLTNFNMRNVRYHSCG